MSGPAWPLIEQTSRRRPTPAAATHIEPALPLPDPVLPQKRPLWRRRYNRAHHLVLEKKPLDVETDVPWSRYLTAAGAYVNPALYDLDNLIEEDTDVESYRRLRKTIAQTFRNFKRR
jgi:hypothetical protein